MVLCTWTCSVMSPKAGRVPSQGVAAGASSGATKVRPERAGGRFWEASMASASAPERMGQDTDLTKALTKPEKGWACG